MKRNLRKHAPTAKPDFDTHTKALANASAFLLSTRLEWKKPPCKKQSGFDNAELLSGVDADLLAVFAHTLKLNGTIDESKKSII